MNLINKNELLKKLSDYELYLLARRFLTEEQLGFSHNSTQCDFVYDEVKKRKKNMFDIAMNDAFSIAQSRLHSLPETRVVDIRRIDFMDKSELEELLQSVGAAINNPVLEDNSANETDIFKLFGISKENFLICNVCGDSMLNAGIFNGDSLIVDINEKPVPEKIVIAYIDNNLLVKRFRKKNGKIRLDSENDAYQSILINDEMNFKIFGVVKFVLHKV